MLLLSAASIWPAGAACRLRQAPRSTSWRCFRPAAAHLQQPNSGGDSVPRPSGVRRRLPPAAAAVGSELLPPTAAAAASAVFGPPRQGAAQPAVDQPPPQQQARQGEKNYITCSARVCVDSRLAGNTPAEGMTAAAGDGAAPGAAALFGQWLERFPISPRTRGIIMLNGLVLLVATNWIVVKDTGASFDAFGFAFLRFAVAAAAFSPFLKAASKDSTVVRAGAEIGIWTAGGYIFQAIGLLTTDASRASFLSAFTVLVVPLLAGLSGKGISALTWGSCAAAVVGMSLLEQNGSPPGIGDVWSLASAVAFGVQMFRTEHWARLLGNDASMPLMSVVLATTMGCAALAAGVAHPDVALSILMDPVSTAQQALTSGSVPWGEVMYCGLATTALVLVLELYALKDVSSVDAAICYTTEPVLGAALACWLLGEQLGPTGMAGASIIVASALAAQVLGKPEEEAEEGAKQESGQERTDTVVAAIAAAKE